MIFSGSDGQLLSRSAFGNLWRRINNEAAVKGRTFHSLRHYYASLLIRHGESVKIVQARLGHASASETLDTYSHLWPDSDDKTREAREAREAVDAYLGSPLRVADGTSAMWQGQ